ncbi:MAG TPA: tetratricopeptide repeat protein, partial [Gemmataceae bacterium]|nr:tetratricopeptide repeat protein [Gemmataceae bacterium]
PNIARVFDGGATDSGRPYFVMELVRGVAITDYCDQNNLPVHERLELFVTVCHAVQHAHQKGIIHRDIKPGNVLVTLHDGRAVPKVIDFGVAKAVGERLTERTLLTRFAQMVGTPLYMSPEQAELTRQDVDTRADIYSLGVLLYELLTGTTPFERGRMRQAALEEIRRMIREEDPPPPSSRLSSTARETQTAAAGRRRIDRRGLSRLVSGDLDWIVMKAIEKDRMRRYQTASGFALDVQRYLADEPVEARPPSAMYRFRKFAHRNRGALLAAIALGLGLFVVLGAVAGSIGWATRDRAARQAAIEREVDLALEEAQRFQDQKRWPEALASARRARGLLAGADASAELRQRIDELESDAAVVLRLEGVHGQPEGPDYFNGIELDAGFAKVFRDYGIAADSLDVKEAAERLRGRRISQELGMALDDWAGMRKRQKEDETWRKLLEIARAADPDPWRNKFRDAWEREDRPGLQRLAETVAVNELPPATMLLLGNALIEQGARETGTNLLREAQQRYPGDLWLNDALAAISRWGSQPPRDDDALRYYTAALAVRPGNYRLHLAVAELLRSQRSFDAAAIAYSRTIELNPMHANARYERGWIYRQQGFNDKALADYTATIALAPQFAEAWTNRGEIYLTREFYDQALSDFSRAIELKPTLVEAWQNRGWAYHKQGQWDQALAAYSKAIELDPSRWGFWHERGLIYWNRRLLEKALDDFTQSLSLHSDTSWVWDHRSWVYQDLERWEEAIADKKKAFELAPQNSEAMNGLAWLLAICPDPKLRDPARAVELAQQAVELAPN